jgi:hypothetical protein
MPMLDGPHLLTSLKNLGSLYQLALCHTFSYLRLSKALIPVRFPGSKFAERNVPKR